MLSHPMSTLVRMELVADFLVGAADDPSLPRPVFDGLTLIQAGVAKLLHHELSSADTHEALAMIDEFEALGRQFDAAKLRLQETIERSGVYAVDGHRGGKAMIAHAGRLSGSEAAGRDKAVRVPVSYTHLTLPTIYSV